MKSYHVVILFMTFSLKAMSVKEAQYYTQEYSAPPAIKQQLDAIPYGIFRTHHHQGDFFVKRDPSRLKGMRLIQNAGKENGCSNVIVPDKYFYQRNGRPFVIATAIDYTHKPFTRELTQQIYTIVQATGYKEIHGGNIKHTTDGKVAFIDTQMEGFKKSSSKNIKKQSLEYLDDIERTLMLDQEAQDYITATKEALKATIA